LFVADLHPVQSTLLLLLLLLPPLLQLQRRFLAVYMLLAVAHIVLHKPAGITTIQPIYIQVV